MVSTNPIGRPADAATLATQTHRGCPLRAKITFALWIFATGCVNDKSLVMIDRDLSVNQGPAEDSAATTGTDSGAGSADDSGTSTGFVEPEGMIFLSGGTFDMGCTPAQEASGECIDDEYPVHAVTLTHDFWIGENEVTQGEFNTLMGFNPSEFPTCGDDCPAECITWYAAAAYANEKSVLEGRQPCYTCEGSGTHGGEGECRLVSNVVCEPAMEPYECSGYRLSTEAEWEFAARCGTDYLYSGSDDALAVSWATESSGGFTHPVGQLPPNDCGLYDMSGNVFEWNHDWYGNDYYTTTPEADPTGPEGGVFRSCRGGGWRHTVDDGHGHLRVGARINRPPTLRDRGLGLRLVLTHPSE